MVLFGWFEQTLKVGGGGVGAGKKALECTLQVAYRSVCTARALQIAWGSVTGTDLVGLGVFLEPEADALLGRVRLREMLRGGGRDEEEEEEEEEYEQMQ